MSDPFAAANLNGNADNGTATATMDPTVDPATMDDPFGTGSEFRGGSFTPSPSLEALDGRLCVMIPRKFDPTAKDPNDPEGKKTRELYTVDLYVLTGGRLAYFYNEKPDQEAGREGGLKEYVVEEVSPESPFSIQGFWVPQGGIIGTLKKIHAAGRPLLGCPDIVPTKPEREKGVTPAQARKAFEAWDAAGRKTQRPKYAWSMADPTGDQRAVAVKWWMANRSDLAPITPGGPLA
jgi:hypothetical protein